MKQLNLANKEYSVETLRIRNYPFFMFSDIGRIYTLLDDVHMICLTKELKDITGQIKISPCPTMFLRK
jgi:hypothetical protein